MTDLCHICSRPVQNAYGESWGSRCRCPSCGFYGITDEALYEIKNKPWESFQVACFMAARNLRGHGATFIASEQVPPAQRFLETVTIKNMLADYPVETIDRVERGFLHLTMLFNKITDVVFFSEERKELIYCQSSDEIVAVARIIMRFGWLENVPSERPPNAIYACACTPAGWEKIRTLKEKKDDVARNQNAFVAMAFSDDMTPIYALGIEPAIVECGFKSVRIDQKQTNNKICDEIIAEIRKSRFVVADFSHQRGGVYFEAGYALGHGKPVIWVVREDEIQSIHFDTRQYAHIVYKNAEDLRIKLANRIRATIGEGPSAKSA